MSADKDFILTIDKSRKQEAIQFFEKFCVNEENFTFNQEKFVHNSSVLIVLNEAEDLKSFRQENEWAQAIPNKVLLGQIEIKIEDDEKFTRFTLWPLSTEIFNLLNMSVELNDYFVEFLEKFDGYDFRIDNGDGSQVTIYIHRAYDS